jgi:hypothetical protein
MESGGRERNARGLQSPWLLSDGAESDVRSRVDSGGTSRRSRKAGRGFGGLTLAEIGKHLGVASGARVQGTRARPGPVKAFIGNRWWSGIPIGNRCARRDVPCAHSLFTPATASSCGRETRTPDMRSLDQYNLLKIQRLLTTEHKESILISNLSILSGISMGLLDALAKVPTGETRAPASMLFYGRDSFHVEHHPRARVGLWRSWLENRRFGIVALGYARPGELESELVKRIDQCAWRVSTTLRSDADIQMGDAIIEVKVVGPSESVLKQCSESEAFNMIAQMLEQAEPVASPWDQFALLIFSDVVKTWNFDRLIEKAIENHPVIVQPEGMAPELLGRYEKARESAVQEFGLLRSDDLARAIHSTAENVSLVASKWRRKGEIFAVNYGGKLGYFSFQFDPMTGRPKPVIAQIIEAFPPNTDGWRLALWLISANARLGNRRPVDTIDQEPEKVIEAAKGENRVELF